MGVRRGGLVARCHRAGGGGPPRPPLTDRIALGPIECLLGQGMVSVPGGAGLEVLGGSVMFWGSRLSGFGAWR